MTRILVFGMTENPGGVEAFLMAYYRQFDRNRLALDFLCNSHAPIAYEEELLASGARTFHITARSQNPLKYWQELRTFFKAHAKDYAAIWVNINSLANIDYLKMAKRYGIPVRIVHSHNSRNMDSRLRGHLHAFNKGRIQRWATDFWACGPEAAQWFYQGETLAKSRIIKNAIAPEKVRFSEAARQRIRQAYDLEDSFVLGNVGRLHFQKNQSFMLKVLRVLLDRGLPVKLVLVGQGPDEAELKQEAADLGLSDQVIFAGLQSDMAAWLSAFDLFFFPSLFEGVSIAALEAQANGLAVLTSQGQVSQEVAITENLTFLPLEKGPEAWADHIQEGMATSQRLDWSSIQQAFDQAGYNIWTAGPALERDLVTRLEEVRHDQD